MKTGRVQSEPSFYYLVMAEACFRQAESTSHPGGSDALREIGRDYLSKARRDTGTAH
jgi:hypothetical protein